tara:strand:- start:315 stop:674 length:360 start_codon:yes stop_codon:yes gene_type:complete
MSKLKPIFIENSRVPVWLSYLAPIDIWALNFAFIVWCRGKMDDRVRQHETIHFHQQLELLFVFQWILYGLFSVIGRFKHGTWKQGYYQNPFELEAYDNDEKEGYLETRKLWAWRHYVGQ